MKISAFIFSRSSTLTKLRKTRFFFCSRGGEKTRKSFCQTQISILIFGWKLKWSRLLPSLYVYYYYYFRPNFIHNTKLFDFRSAMAEEEGEVFWRRPLNRQKRSGWPYFGKYQTTTKTLTAARMITPDKLIYLLTSTNQILAEKNPGINCMPMGLCSCVYGTFSQHFEKYGFVSPSESSCLVSTLDFEWHSAYTYVALATYKSIPIFRQETV